jgi:hypothetical protein
MLMLHVARTRNRPTGTNVPRHLSLTYDGPRSLLCTAGQPPWIGMTLLVWQSQACNRQQTMDNMQQTTDNNRPMQTGRQTVDASAGSAITYLPHCVRHSFVENAVVATPAHVRAPNKWHRRMKERHISSIPVEVAPVMMQRLPSKDDAIEPEVLPRVLRTYFVNSRTCQRQTLAAAMPKAEKSSRNPPPVLAEERR